MVYSDLFSETTYKNGYYEQKVQNRFNKALRAKDMRIKAVESYRSDFPTLRLGLYLILISLLCSAGCQGGKFIDTTGTVEPQHLTVPEAEYRSVAWLDNDHIAFDYRQESFGDEEADRRIGLLTVSSGDWHEIPLPSLPEHCFPRPSGISHLSRLPNGNLGFVQHCLGAGVSGSLYMWDKRTNIIELVQVYNVPFFATSYTFSPDMTEFIQEDSEGAGLSDNLFRVNRNGKMEQILPHFVRAREPSWSPNEQTIAFSGTESAPEQTSDPMTWTQIESLALYPWDLYLMDADGSNIRILMPQVGRPYQLKWSPSDSNLLAFAGDIYDSQGIWILNTNTLELKRIWEQNTFYDWSPDGQSMIIVTEEGEGDTRRTYPIIIDVPSN